MPLVLSIHITSKGADWTLVRHCHGSRLPKWQFSSYLTASKKTQCPQSQISTG